MLYVASRKITTSYTHHGAGCWSSDSTAGLPALACVSSREQERSCLFLTADSPSTGPWLHVTLSISAVLSGAIMLLHQRSSHKGSPRLVTATAETVFEHGMKYTSLTWAGNETGF